MNITITEKELEAFVNEKVQSGAYKSVEDMVVESLRLLKDVALHTQLCAIGSFVQIRRHCGEPDICGFPVSWRRGENKLYQI